MSDRGPTCFGKLPLAAIEQLQLSRGSRSRYWVDAVPVPSTDGGLVSIDTVRLEPTDLSGSIVLAMLHSMNDLYASNSIPRWCSISMTLPSSADMDELLRINTAADECASLINCVIAKLHTSRADGQPTATVCVGGILTAVQTDVAEKGVVVLAGHNQLAELGGIPSSGLLQEQISIRKHLASSVPGPKKDVSGEGIAGALVQISRRENVSIKLQELNCRDWARADVPSINLRNNFYDYAPLIRGLNLEQDNTAWFQAHLFGPILCLAENNEDLDPSVFLTIGAFEKGPADVEIVRS